MARAAGQTRDHMYPTLSFLVSPTCAVAGPLFFFNLILYFTTAIRNMRLIFKTWPNFWFFKHSNTCKTRSKFSNSFKIYKIMSFEKKFIKINICIAQSLLKWPNISRTKCRTRFNWDIGHFCKFLRNWLTKTFWVDLIVNPVIIL